MACSESKYSLISESDTENNENASFLKRSTFPLTRHDKRIWIIHAILLLTSTALFVASFLQYHVSSTPVPSMEPAYTQEYKPLVDDVGKFHSWQYRGEFHQPSIDRGDPNPELDAAWDHISLSGVIAVTEEDLARVGKLSNSSVKLPQELGGQYMASLEAGHQMHCLDMLRKWSYKDYYADKFELFSKMGKFRIHLDHCTELLRQSIMCNTDLHIVTYNWVDHVDYPWPDFSINRQCRNYYEAVDWMHEKRIRTTTPGGMVYKPAGQATKHVPPVEYVHEWTDPNKHS